MSGGSIPPYSHCYLIIPISAWLIWEKRASLLSRHAGGEPGGAGLGDPFYRAVAGRPLRLHHRIPPIRRGRPGGGLHHRHSRLAHFPPHLLRLPLSLLPGSHRQYLIPPLQEITAKFVEHGLTLFGITFYRDGLIFDLVNGRYEIAEACAGLRFLVATVALGALFAHMMFRRPCKIALFMLACAIVPVIGNGIRALMTVTGWPITPTTRVAAGFDHIVYGWVFAVAIIFGVMYVGAKFKDPEADAAPPPGTLRGCSPPRWAPWRSFRSARPRPLCRTGSRDGASQRR